MRLARYLHGLAELEEIVAIEHHVGRCSSCRGRLVRMKRHDESLFEEHEPGARVQTSSPSCPSHLQLEHYARSALRERQMVRVQEHVRSCPSCREQVFGSGAPASARVPRLQVGELLCTRAPDLDLRVAPEGVRIEAGVALVDHGILPTLAQRLDLRQYERPLPQISSSRRLYFERREPGWALRGRIALTGLEGLSLELRLLSAELEPESFELWSRERVLARPRLQRGGAPFHCLLPLGHYFAGPSAEAPPWLVLAVEPDLLSTGELLACAYDFCSRGCFHAGLVCLERAVELEPGTPGGAKMLQLVRDFAARFGLADADLDIHWLATPDSAGKQVAEPEALDLSLASEADVERVAELVKALSRRVQADPLVGVSGRFVSRRQFRSAYALLLRALLAHLPSRVDSAAAPAANLARQWATTCERIG